ERCQQEDNNICSEFSLSLFYFPNLNLNLNLNPLLNHLPNLNLTLNLNPLLDPPLDPPPACRCTSSVLLAGRVGTGPSFGADHAERSGSSVPGPFFSQNASDSWDKSAPLSG